MPRKLFIESNQFPYHVCSRSINKDWFDIPIDEVWNIFSKNLYFTKHAFNLHIHAFVLMSNHFHLIVSTPDANLSESMKYFISNVSRDIRQKSSRINHIFKQKFFRSQIKSDIHFYNVYKYVYRNPIEAGICNLVEEYHYSTLPGLLGNTHLFIPVEEDSILFEDDILNCLSWLNRQPSDEFKRDMQCALKKRDFKLRIDPNSKREHRLNFELY